MAEGQERTERATPRRRQKAREKGQFARSKELTSVAGMAGMMLVLYFGGKHFIVSAKGITVNFLTLSYGTDPFIAIKIAMAKTLLLLFPFLLGVIVLAVTSEISQVGFMLKDMELNFGRMNPIEGIKRLFSINGIFDFLKNLLKFIGGILIFYLVIKADIVKFSYLLVKDFNQMTYAAYDLLKEAIWYGFLYLFIIALVSFVIEKYRFEESIKMSKQEIKEEHKDTEGDPKVKSKIRGIQREISRRRMMAQVPKATVVITNPTHLAIAILYKEGDLGAPKIVAKGSGFVAEKIRELARKHKVPVVEDKPLARLLFKLDIDTYIPQELYKAVARILAYIYKLQGKI
ncbi:MAG: flagellar biosynthesis protein FlhB [Nitrospirae bacterium]|nr:flagellar biosynthesis protein FlhB [Nitrospirota bacterium]MBF0535437.1 flagellar biosynthesis protein FlhB [Nitrospirota bacterium]MBF0617625.1 flagellar biosynthesis protein FlhB [Nitrospirota bacterium]